MTLNGLRVGRRLPQAQRSLRNWGALGVLTAAMAIATPLAAPLLLSSVWVATRPAIATAQAGTNQPIRLDANNLEANSVTGVVTARGNVRITYPARNMQATSVQAQYFSREGRIVLIGNVYVLQNGNSLRAETITYLVTEGRFVATPDQGRQVEAIYLIPDPNPAVGPAAAPPLPTGATPNTAPALPLPPLPQ